MKLGLLSPVVASITYAIVAIAGLAQTSCSVLADVLDELGVIKPALAVQSPSLQVFIRDEALHDPNHSQPRIYVKNTSTTQSISNFTVHYYFKTENGGVPVLGIYWAPGSQVTMQQAEGNIWRVVYDFAGTTLGPGQIVPDSSGNVIGLNYATYTDWNEGNDWSAYGVKSWFTLTNRVVVVSSNNEVLYGQLPPEVDLDDSTGTTSTSSSSSSSPTSSSTSSSSSESTEEDDGSGDQTLVNFVVKHPHQLRREDIALGTAGR